MTAKYYHGQRIWMRTKKDTWVQTRYYSDNPAVPSFAIISAPAEISSRERLTVLVDDLRADDRRKEERRKNAK